MPEMNGACLFVNMMCLEKPVSLIFQIGCSGCTEKIRCFGFAKLDCLVLVDRTYASLNLIFVNHLSCASYITCSSHTFVAHLECIHIGGTLLDFHEKCAKWHL
jgi:hypothetical protein